MKFSKILSIILAIALIISVFAGCSGNSTGEPETSSTSCTTETTQPEETAQEDTKADTDGSEVDVDYAGTVLNGTYHNEYFDFRFTPESDWVFYSDDQLLELNELSSARYGAMAKETFNSRIEEGGSLSVMYASNLWGENINMVVQKTPEMLTSSTEDLYYTYLKTMLVGEYEKMGFSDVSIDLVQTIFIGETKSALLTNISSLGMIQMQKFVVGGDYTCVLTISTYSEDSAHEIMGKFHGYDPNFNAGGSADAPTTSQSKFEDVSGRTKIATTVEEFDSVIGNFVNLDHYDKQTPYSNADQISTYRMKSDISKMLTYDLDYTITAEGITFSLPITCGDLEAAGWDCRNNLASEVESSDRMGVTVSFRNHAGKEFFASVVNRSGVTKQLKDCYVVGVNFDKYTHNYTENITTLSDTAPFVTVCGDLDSNSSLQDVLNRLGEPWMIEFYTDGDANYEPLAFVRLTYQVRSDTEYGCLKIAIAAETDDVMIIDYDHELAS